MKRTLTLVIGVAVVATLFVLGVVPHKQAIPGVVPTVHAQEGCTLATLQGDYLFSGRSDSRDDAPQGTFPHVSVGVHSFDGAGNFAQRSTISRGGVIDHETAIGIYTLNADCTGTVTYRLEGGAADLHWDIVVTRDGTEGVYVRTDPGTIATRSIKKQ